MAERFLKYETTNESLPVDNHGVLTNDIVVIKSDDVIFYPREGATGIEYLGANAKIFASLKEALVNEKPINCNVYRTNDVYIPFNIERSGFGYDEATDGYKYEVIALKCLMMLDATATFYIFSTDEARENY